MRFVGIGVLVVALFFAGLLFTVIQDVGAVGSAGSATDCMARCTAGDPDCLLVNYRNADELGSLAALRPALLADLPIILQRETIASLFQMEEHPLMQTRGDVAVSEKGDFENTGEAREVVFVSLLDESVSVGFPASLQGRLWQSGDSIRLEFPDSEQALAVGFSNELLDQYFGGPILKIDSTPERGVLTLPNGCIEVPLQQSLLLDQAARATGTAALIGATYLSESISSLSSSDFGSDYFCNPPHPACEEVPD